jgi:hypothetical protein
LHKVQSKNIDKNENILTRNLQRKPESSSLKVSGKNDVQEKEADAVAEKVMLMPDQPASVYSPYPNQQSDIQLKSRENQGQLDLQKSENDKENDIQLMPESVAQSIHGNPDDDENSTPTDSIQPKMLSSEPPDNTVPKNFHRKLNNTKGQGQSLPGNIQADLGAKMNSDLKNVRIHDNPSAADMASKVQAKAFTHGSDIYFNSGQYNTQSNQGKHLLTHEVTHTLQNNQNNNNSSIQRKIWCKEPEEDGFQPLISDANTQDGFITDGIWLAEELGGYNSVILFSQFGLDIFNLSGELVDHVNALEGEPWLKHSIWSVELGKVKMLGIRGDYYYEEGRRMDYRVFSEEKQKEIRARESQNIWLFHDMTETSDTELDKKGFLPAILIFGEVVVPNEEGEDEESKMEFEPIVVEAKVGKGTGITTPKWVRDQQKAIRTLIAKAKEKKPVPLDIPDHVQSWYNQDIDTWYLNVWVYFGTDKSKKFNSAIKLREGESIDDLFTRVKEATIKAYQQSEKRQGEEEQKAMPKWVQDLKKQVEKKVKRIRQKDKKARNIPDGIEAVMKSNKGNKPEDIQYFFRVYVERGEKKKERNYGIVPWPLTEETIVSEILPVIREYSAVLRQFEHEEVSDSEAGIILPSDKMALAAFPSSIIPEDLPPNNITVTGANNKFHMRLDYEAVYGTGELKDLFIASKLSQQYIKFIWNIYKLPENLKLEGDKPLSDNWAIKWKELYDLYNTDKYSGAKKSDEIPPLGKKVTGDSSSDSTIELEFIDEPGEYIVECITAHTPIGEYKLRRTSSRSFYPVLTRPIKEIAEGMVSNREMAIDYTGKEIEALQDMQKSEDFTANQKELFASVETVKTEYFERTKAKESHGVTENIENDLFFISETLKKLKILEEIIPGVLDQAEKQGVSPSVLIAQTDKKLVDLYRYIIWEKKTIKGYIEELEANQEQLEKVLTRANEFSPEICSDKEYAPEAAFVSSVTGQIYPLILMIAELPHSEGENYEFSLIDITCKQTQKEYSGSGPTRLEALNDAFEDFGDEAMYGEGKIAVRIPSGPLKDTYVFDSEKGFVQEVMYILGIVAAVAGAAALVATGVGAPAAALWLGLVAGVAGAATAIYHIKDRADRHTLEWDAETAMDIISIVGVIPVAATAGMATKLPRTVAGFSRYAYIEDIIRVYGYAETGATIILVPVKLKQDFDKIDADVRNGDLSEKEAESIKSQLIFNTMQTGLMMLGSAAAARSGAEISAGRRSPAELEALDQQARFVEMEGVKPNYKSLEERGLKDTQGNWTPEGKKAYGISDAPENAKSMVIKPDVPVDVDVPQTIKQGVAEPSEPPQLFKTLRKGVVSGQEVPLNADSQLKSHSTYGISLNGDEAYAMYNEALTRSGGKEVGLYYHPDSGEYVVRVGNEISVNGPADKDGYIALLHFHPNPHNAFPFRLPSPNDYSSLIPRAFREGKVYEIVEYNIPGVGRGRTEYGIDLSEDLPFYVTVFKPDGSTWTKRFANDAEFTSFWSSKKVYMDPDSPEYKKFMESENYGSGTDDKYMISGPRSEPVDPETLPMITETDPRFRQQPKVGESWRYTDRGGTEGRVSRISEDKLAISTRLGQSTIRADYQNFVNPSTVGLPSGKKGFNALHALGKIVGHESPFGIYFGPWRVNHLIQKSGIERFIRDIGQNILPGREIQLRVEVERVTYPVLQKDGSTIQVDFLKRITYQLYGSEIHPKNKLFELGIEVNEPNNPKSKVSFDDDSMHLSSELSDYTDMDAVSRNFDPEFHSTDPKDE